MMNPKKQIIIFIILFILTMILLYIDDINLRNSIKSQFLFIENNFKKNDGQSSNLATVNSNVLKKVFFNPCKIINRDNSFEKDISIQEMLIFSQNRLSQFSEASIRFYDYSMADADTQDRYKMIVTVSAEVKGTSLNGNTIKESYTLKCTFINKKQFIKIDQKQIIVSWRFKEVQFYAAQ